MCFCGRVSVRSFKRFSRCCVVASMGTVELSLPLVPGWMCWTMFDDAPPPSVFVFAMLATPCRGTDLPSLLDPLVVDDDHARRFYKHWYTSKKKAFTRYAKKFADAPQEIDAELGRIKQYAQVVRVIAHTQVRSERLVIALPVCGFWLNVVRSRGGCVASWKHQVAHPGRGRHAGHGQASCKTNRERCLMFWLSSPSSCFCCHTAVCNGLQTWPFPLSPSVGTGRPCEAEAEEGAHLRDPGERW